MESVRSFLESSTIHGLVYISRPGKLSRLIWILVVIAGFSGAGVMIYQSFQSWAESPVKTTIETLPITEITLPKVTVCPPKNTFTNLNYDLMMLENMTLDNDTRDELTQFAVELIQDLVYNELMANISKFQEENRYYNWYMGYSYFSYLPYWGHQECQGVAAGKGCVEDRLRFNVISAAKSGTISNQYFGERFDKNKLERNFKYTITIRPPTNNQSIGNLSLFINVESNMMEGFDKFWSDNEIPVTTLHRNITPSGANLFYIFERKISEDELNDIHMDSMPGFRITWHYNKLVQPPSLINAGTYEFIRCFKFNYIINIITQLSKIRTSVKILILCYL